MPEDFREQLNVLLNQDFEDYKILYLNSGSNWIEEELVSIESDKVIYQEVVPEEFNHGLTRNMAFNFVTEETQYLAYLTHDSIPMTNSWLRCLIEPMQRDSLCAFTFGRQHLLENANYFEKQDMIRHFDNLESTGSAVLGSLRWHKKRENYRQRLHFNSNANSAYRVEHILRKNFPEADFGEDQLLANELIMEGFRGSYAKNSDAVHDNRLFGYEIIRRAFDEARFFRVKFDYHLGVSPLLIPITLVKIASFQFGKVRWNMKHSLWLWGTRKSLANLGHYLGSRFLFVSTPRILSRDARLKLSKNFKSRRYVSKFPR